MEKFVKGEVLAVPFPFSDLSDFKRRPVLVIATPEGEDIIVCQITSRQRNDNYSVEITNSDFERGSLNLKSFARTQRIFTMDKTNRNIFGRNTKNRKNQSG